jgi:hypothetical protein
VRHKPREGSVCRQLSFPTRWSAILADLWPASLEPAILPRGPSPPGPRAAGWAGRSASVVLGLRGEMQLFWADMDRADSLSGGASPNARCWITSRPTSTSPAAECCRSACYATPSTSPVPTDHRLFLPPARCHRDRAVLRGHPPPRGACQDRPAATPRPYSAWPDRNHPTLHPRERPERQTRTTAGARPAGIQNAQICAQRKSRPHRPAAAPNGGYRVTTATSNRHAARLLFQSASEPSAK